MAIKKAIFKIFNGSTWDEYHHKTDSAQVAHTNSDNSATTAEAIFNGTIAKAALASGVSGDITLKKHGNIVIALGRLKTTAKTTGTTLATIPVGYRPNRYVRLLAPRYDLRFGNIGINADGVVSLVHDTQLSESPKEYYINLCWVLE